VCLGEPDGEICGDRETVDAHNARRVDPLQEWPIDGDQAL